MKTLLITILALTSLNIFAVEYTSKIKCTNGVCDKEQTFKGVADPDLKYSDLSVDQCLMDVKQNKVYRVLSLDASTTRVTTLVESSEYILKRENQYFNSSAFNRQMKVIPCNQTPGIVGDEANYQKCVSTNGKNVNTLYCEKERKHDF